MKKNAPGYFLVKINETVELGLATAAMLGALRAISKGRKKDRDGYFTTETTYLAKVLGVTRATTITLRNKLVAARKIDFVEGKNQNAKNKYKIF